MKRLHAATFHQTPVAVIIAPVERRRSKLAWRRIATRCAKVRGVAAEHSAQHPTLSPEGLIPYVTLPLAGAGAVANGFSPLGVKETGP